jgi:hypothetical protein
MRHIQYIGIVYTKRVPSRVEHNFGASALWRRVGPSAPMDAINALKHALATATTKLLPASQSAEALAPSDSLAATQSQGEAFARPVVARTTFRRWPQLPTPPRQRGQTPISAATWNRYTEAREAALRGRYARTTPEETPPRATGLGIRAVVDRLASWMAGRHKTAATPHDGWECANPACRAQTTCQRRGPYGQYCSRRECRRLATIALERATSERKRARLASISAAMEAASQATAHVRGRAALAVGTVWVAPSQHARQSDEGDCLVARAAAELEQAVRSAIMAGQFGRVLRQLDVGELTVLHAPQDPGPSGIYEEHVLQKSSYAYKTFRLALLERHLTHDPRQVLLCSSGEGMCPELMYLPSVWALERMWIRDLTVEEVLTCRSLRAACKNLAALLRFRLTERWTLENALCKLAHLKEHWFHGCLHLRWNCQCAGAAAEIHNFPLKRKRRKARALTRRARAPPPRSLARRDDHTRLRLTSLPPHTHPICHRHTPPPSLSQANDGCVLDPGTVQLVYSNHGKPDGPKAAFLRGMVLPLAKMLQSILLTLPLALRKRMLPTINLDLFGLQYSYVSLNVFWDRHVADASSLPGKYFHHLGNCKQWKRLVDWHNGLYLHRDQNNDGWGAVLIYGADFSGFDQRYVTFAVRLPCPGWSLVIGDFRRLLHCVESGSGLRFSLVLALHKSVTEGIDEFDREVYHYS